MRREGEIVIDRNMPCDICGHFPDKVASFWWNEHYGVIDGVWICLSCLYRAVNMLKSEPAPAVAPL